MSNFDLSKQPWYLLVEHAVVLFGAAYVLRKLTKGGLLNNITRLTLDVAQALPGTKDIVEKEQKEAIKQVESMIFDGVEDDNVMEEIPDNGLSAERVMEILQEWRDKEEGYRSGKAFGGIYTDYEEVEDLEKKALNLYCDSNGLYPTTFPGLRKLEAEMVRMSCALLHGDKETCGTMTSGGTER